MEANPLLIILGPTASGKTRLAVQVAKALSGEIISADSRQIFTEMDLGTGKDLNEYCVDGIQIPYHLINILKPGNRYNVSAFKSDFYNAFSSIIKKNKLPILCGGTGMYIHSILQNHEFTEVPVDALLRDELIHSNIEDLRGKLSAFPDELRNHADLSSKKRIIRAIEIATYLSNHDLKVEKKPEMKPLVFGLKNLVEITRKKILDRLDLRLKQGMIEEVKGLLDNGVDPEMLVFYGLEYKFITQYLSGRLTFNLMKERLGTAICQFAKRQMTFFRKMEKDGVSIHWLNAQQDTDQLKEEIITTYMRLFR